MSEPNTIKDESAQLITVRLYLILGERTPGNCQLDVSSRGLARWVDTDPTPERELVEQLSLVSAMVYPAAKAIVAKMRGKSQQRARLTIRATVLLSGGVSRHYNHEQWTHEIPWIKNGGSFASSEEESVFDLANIGLSEAVGAAFSALQKHRQSKPEYQFALFSHEEIAAAAVQIAAGKVPHG